MCQDTQPGHCKNDLRILQDLTQHSARGSSRESGRKMPMIALQLKTLLSARLVSRNPVTST